MHINKIYFMLHHMSITEFTRSLMYWKDSSHASNKLSPICNLFVSMKYGEKDEITEEKLTRFTLNDYLLVQGLTISLHWHANEKIFEFSRPFFEHRVEFFLNSITGY